MQAGDENKENYQLGYNYHVDKAPNSQINIQGNEWQSVRRIHSQILGVKRVQSHLKIMTGEGLSNDP